MFSLTKSDPIFELPGPYFIHFPYIALSCRRTRLCTLPIAVYCALKLNRSEMAQFWGPSLRDKSSTHPEFLHIWRDVCHIYVRVQMGAGFVSTVMDLVLLVEDNLPTHKWVLEHIDVPYSEDGTQ
ncbi:hypothetical protein CEXT_502301 [Caerostris extrusa]|uniref:DUF5641 domain-containing protein n=1 Tax=Caerostris extrusa TaxID=172846 RepID=A0AAV4T034_CAEEX|nr:hypothetical protein CEXT_502301 [Caerostris extrusa]